MCTAVVIPGKDGWYFASLRDEDPMRERALLPTICSDNNASYLSPLDPAGNGTWIGVNEYGQVIILLNGGFKNHIKQPEYAQSRGIIVKELLSDKMPVLAWLLMDLKDIEPFTLIVWAEKKLFQLVWDGQKKHRVLLSNKIPHIFSSATLYDEIYAGQRKGLFDAWVKTDRTVTALSLSIFFAKALPDTKNGFIINRNEKIRTLSYSFIEVKNEGSATFHYYDLSTNQNNISTMPLLTKNNACSYTLNK
ncbi:MAG: NRDE family protein [Ferruginibacter sp.]